MADSIFRAELNTKHTVPLKRTRLHGVKASTCIYTAFTAFSLIRRLSYVSFPDVRLLEGWNPVGRNAPPDVAQRDGTLRHQPVIR